MFSFDILDVESHGYVLSNSTCAVAVHIDVYKHAGDEGEPA
jgi:hypothetical protein